MIHRLRHLLLRHSHRRSSGGYILVTTLVAMLLCVVLIASMLAVTASTVKVEETGRQRERQQRSAEGAIDVAVNQIRNDPTIAAAYLDPAYDPAGPDPLVPGDPGYDPAKDPTVNPELSNSVCDPVTNLTEVDGMQVRVKCYNQGLTTTDNQGNTVTGLPVDDGSVAVRLVGGEYSATADHVPNPGNAVPNGTDVARTWKSGFPFNGAMQNFSQPEIDSTQGQFLYTGARTLPVVGGIEVKRQIAAVTAAGVAGPAIDVQGTAAQGGAGMFAGSTGTDGCGIQETDDSYNSPRADVKVTAIWDPSNAGMQCSNSELSAMAAGGLPLGSGDWDNARVMLRKYRFESTPNNFVPLPTDCNLLDPANTGVISLEGSFTKEQTKILNGWWSDENNAYPGNAATPCNDKTFLFEGGDIWFDVDDPALPESDPRKHSLTFANTKSNWVFGRPLNWAGNRPALDQFPERSGSSAACDRKAPTVDSSSGINITLSSRTGWHHQGGRLVVCGPIVQNGTHTTAIGQRPATSLGARLLPTGLTLAGNWGPGGATAAVVQNADRNSIQVSQSMTGSNTSCWDSGTCSLAQTQFRVSGFGNGAPNGAWPGDGPMTSSDVWVDVSGDAEFANQPNSWIRLGLNLADGQNCYMKYGPGATIAERLPDNYALTSYNLGSTVGTTEGNCATVLANGIANGSITRQDFLNSYVNVQVALAPPKERNTAWGWFNWLCQGIAAVGNWTGWWNLGCDNRPTSITYKFDSISMRLGWSPSVAFDSPNNDLDSPRDGNGTRPFLNAGDAATKNAVFAYTTTGTATNPVTSFSNLRFFLRDYNLLDGFLPIQSLSLASTMRKPATIDAATDRVDFVVKTHSGVWCRRQVMMSGITNDTSQSVTLTPGTTYVDASDGITKPTCTVGGDRFQPVTSIDSGELVAHRNSDNVETLATATKLDIEVFMRATGADRTFQIDNASVSATAAGYARPADPFTVTWNPQTPNSAFDPRPGDATFNVFGSVSVPNNDVRVLYNWSANSSGPRGFPIFNGGSVPYNNCNPQNREQCRPALVASALGVWTTGSWPAAATATAAQQPDALASTGETRPPFRQVLLYACVIDTKGTAAENDDELLPKAMAQAKVADKSAGYSAPGAAVTVTEWKEIGGNPLAYGAAAKTKDCSVGG